MPSTTTYEFGDVVLVSFPFTNLQSTKKRPAVVISKATYQHGRPDVILMAITSQIRQPMAFGEHLIQDWQQAGLLKPSVLKPLIATLEQSQIVTVMGRLSQTDQQGLHDSLDSILGHGAR